MLFTKYLERVSPRESMRKNVEGKEKLPGGKLKLTEEDKLPLLDVELLPEGEPLKDALPNSGGDVKLIGEERNL